jgi:acetylornithine/N-succinyldiaminopimelate aminotransferase
MSKSLMQTYNRLPITFAHGNGAWLTDTEGKRYLDALSGIAVCGLGHAHPAVTEALREQVGKLLHTSNLYHISAQNELGDMLTQMSGMERVFFGNSGAEANEAAIKLARLHGREKGIDKPAIVVMERSFHGRTLATLSATGSRKAQAGFEPLVQGFVRVPYNDIAAIQSVAENRQDIVAVLVEPVQGEGGINIPDDGYLAGIREICDANGWLMMLDEIQSGMGRTGQYFAFQHTNIQPDVITLAKSLGNGVPIGACLARGEAADLFAPGNHGSTFGGNPLVCQAALVVCKTLVQERLEERAAQLGERILSGLQQNLRDAGGVRGIRGKGLMLAIELDRPCGELVNEALADGLLINVTAERVVRLLPPLVMSDMEADQLVVQLSKLIVDFLAEKS